MNWKLRSATPDDRPFLFELHRAALGAYIEQTWGWDEEWQRDHFELAFESANWQVIVVDGVDAGALRVTDRERELHIEDIEILPALQGRGLGTLVLESLIARATAGGKIATLQVLKVNPARRLYERLGFVVTGEDDAHIRMRR